MKKKWNKGNSRKAFQINSLEENKFEKPFGVKRLKCWQFWQKYVQHNVEQIKNKSAPPKGANQAIKIT